MTRQALLENVLDMWLDQKQLAYLETEWHAFYSEPLKYANTVIVDMVKLGLEGM